MLEIESVGVADSAFFISLELYFYIRENAFGSVCEKSPFFLQQKKGNPQRLLADFLPEKSFFLRAGEQQKTRLLNNNMKNAAVDEGGGGEGISFPRAFFE